MSKDKKVICTVLVNLCDKYEEAWDSFFSLMAIYWPNCKYNIYLNTETKEYQFSKGSINEKVLIRVLLMFIGLKD